LRKEDAVKTRHWVHTSFVFMKDHVITGKPINLPMVVESLNVSLSSLWRLLIIIIFHQINQLKWLSLPCKPLTCSRSPAET
jgi:hypothetical protein